jgi:hypothetical protein
MSWVPLTGFLVAQKLFVKAEGPASAQPLLPGLCLPSLSFNPTAKHAQTLGAHKHMRQQDSSHFQDQKAEAQSGKQLAAGT